MTKTELNTTSLFLEFSRHKLLDEYWPRLKGCIELLTDEQAWWRPNEASNSIGNLLLHLNGNVQQWLVVPFAGAQDSRDRPAEFKEKQVIDAEVLLRQLGETLRRAGEVLAHFREPDLLRRLDIQGYQTTGVEAVYHVVEHFGMHCGQIFYITKMLRHEDLGFYRELNETGRAS